MSLTKIGQLANKSINQKGLGNVLIATDIICRTESIAKQLLLEKNLDNQDILQAKSFSRNTIHLSILFAKMNTFKLIEGDLLIAIKQYGTEHNYPEIKGFRLTLIKQLDILS